MRTQPDATLKTTTSLKLLRLNNKINMDTKRDSINTHAVRALAKNLAKDYPRSPREILCGYVIAARTLDKCREFLVSHSKQWP